MSNTTWSLYDLPEGEVGDMTGDPIQWLESLSELERLKYFKPPAGSMGALACLKYDHEFALLSTDRCGSCYPTRVLDRARHQLIVIEAVFEEETA